MNDFSVQDVEERLGQLFQPDSLVNSEYFNSIRRSTVLEPEKSLMLAILEDAVGCFQGYIDSQNPKGKKLFEEARDWIFDRNDEWIFSFNNICEVFGQDPDYLRMGLLKWQERRLLLAPHRQPYSRN
jgi:hypothetical protein